jgi:hypothetical protein
MAIFDRYAEFTPEITALFCIQPLTSLYALGTTDVSVLDRCGVPMASAPRFAAGVLPSLHAGGAMESEGVIHEVHDFGLKLAVSY